MRKVSLHASAYLFFCIVLAIGASSHARAAQPCASLAKFSMAEHRVVVRAAKLVSASAPGVTPALPEHCRVDGVIDERTGRDGKPYGIGFAVALPRRRALSIRGATRFFARFL